MDEKERNEIAIFRYGIISPILHSGKKNQKKYFKEMAKKTYDVPHLGRKEYEWTTFKDWLKKYGKSSIDGLRPKMRSDKGQSRKIDEELGNVIKEVKEEYPYLSCCNLYRLLLDQNRLPYPPLNEGTLRLFLKNTFWRKYPF